MDKCTKCQRLLRVSSFNPAKDTKFIRKKRRSAGHTQVQSQQPDQNESPSKDFNLHHQALADEMKKLFDQHKKQEQTLLKIKQNNQLLLKNVPQQPPNNDGHSDATDDEILQDQKAIERAYEEQVSKMRVKEALGNTLREASNNRAAKTIRVLQKNHQEEQKVFDDVGHTSMRAPQHQYMRKPKLETIKRQNVNLLRSSYMED